MSAVVDFIREQSDAEMLSLAGLQEEEDIFSTVWKSAKNRWVWLAVNLVTAVIASRVIGIFEGTIEELVGLLDLYSEGRFDAFVLPSLHEGISVALIEAMSRGLPVVATDVGGTRELLTDGTGQLIPAEDVGSLAEALKILLRDETGRVRQAQRGRERVMAEYDIVKVVDALEDLDDVQEVYANFDASDEVMAQLEDD